MAQTLHGARHPGHRGAPVPPHCQAGLRHTPDAADPGAEKAIQSGPTCGSEREVRARAPVHARDANRKQQPEGTHGDLIGWALATSPGISSVFSEALFILDLFTHRWF